MASVLTAAPAEEPVTVAEAKLHLRVDHNADDTLIGALITAARQRAEIITRRSLVTQSWKLVMDKFPAPGMNVGSANWYGPQWGISPGPLTTQGLEGKTGYEIALDRGPIVSVETVKYIDENGVQQTLANTEYKVDNVTEPGRLVPAYGKTWPGTRNEIAAVEVNYTAGYGGAAAVPEALKAWIKLRVGALYENREEFISGRNVTVVEMPFVDSLLQDFRILTF